ncbi:HlyD family efflux transporter periplasmic adaptor subunit [Neopoerus faecalis]|uniref:HlyD family efflux transporter periplasmic adaptor subunit n=1 Tax=Neopoerus faecalis TaxID=3032125 RepID=UPI0025709A03|nr:HlyD family efflux transporter periplasmic adaptor subunit [Neopoerus faecalis]
MAENMSSQKTEGKLKKLLSGKKGRRWLVLCVLAVAVIGGGTAFLSRTRAKAAKAETIYTTASVEKRSITNALTGSGTLQPADSYTVTTLVSGEVLSDTFEEGDIVEKDQLLYTIDSSDVSTTETQAQTNYTQALKAKYPTADISGTVSEVYVSNGDAVSAGTELCRISASNDLTIDFQFSYAKDGDFYVGQPAKIYLNGYAGYIDGTVAQIGSSSVANGTGMKMTTVRVKAANPGLVSGDCTASAVVGNYTSYGQTTVKVGTGSTITATASGKVSGLTLMPGDSVSSGQRICTITGDSVDNQLQNAKASLENAQDRLDDYMVTSPITGTVVEKTVKAGDNVGTGSNSNNTLCIIYDLTYLEMTLNIDELDIDNVEVGQTVNITSDAKAGQTYTGVVTKVSVVGTTSGGTTTYPVTVRIDDTDGLRPGMNVDAEIVLSSADGVLAIPSLAVNRGDTVLVTSDSPSAANALEQEAPEGYAYVQVTTGVSDDSYIEITSGLQEGDAVAYLRTASSGSDMMMSGMPGGDMGGGMPGGGGGMPSGGPGGGGPGGGF